MVKTPLNLVMKGIQSVGGSVFATLRVRAEKTLLRFPRNRKVIFLMKDILSFELPPVLVTLV
jgi:hypothetical protein